MIFHHEGHENHEERIYLIMFIFLIEERKTTELINFVAFVVNSYNFTIIK
jgi:hypothetical protein